MDLDEIIKESRESFKGNWGEIFLSQIISNMVSGALSFLSLILPIVLINLVYGWSIDKILVIFVLFIIGTFFNSILTGPIWVWKNNFILKKSRGEVVSISSFSSVFTVLKNFKNFECIKKFFSNKELILKTLSPFITLLFFYLSIILGYILLLIPGIIISFMFFLVPFISVEEKNLQPMEILQKSKEKMDGNKMNLFWLYVKLIPLFIICILPCGLGLFWFGPYLSIVSAKFYDSIKKQ